MFRHRPRTSPGETIHVTDSTTRPAPSPDDAPPSRSAARPERPDWAILALFAILAAIFLHDVLFTGRAYLLRDILTFFHPWQFAVREAVRGGHLPLWNPDTYCGIPLLANLQSGFFYPPNWLYWGLPFDFALSLGMAIHLTLAGFLTRGFLRRTGLGERGAFLGGALFAFGSWTLSYLEFPMKIGSIVWTPLIWSGLWVAMREGRRRGLAMAGAGVALSVFAGYPQLAAYGFLSATLLAIALAVDVARDPQIGAGGKLYRLAAWPLALALGALLAAAQLLPAQEMVGLSGKALAYDANVALSRSLPPRGLLGLLDPFLFGFPGSDRFWGGEIGEYCFGAFYPGLLSLVLVAAAMPTLLPWRRPRRVRREDRAIVDPGPLLPRSVPAFLVAGAALGALLALGRHTPIVPRLHELVPAFGRTRWPATAGVLIALHVAPLAGIGLEWALRERSRVRSIAWVATGLGFATLATWLLALGPLAGVFRELQLAGAPPFQLAAYEAARGAWLEALLVRGCGILAAGALGLVIGQIRSQAATAWTALILFDLFCAARALEMPTARGFYDRTPESVASLREELDGRRLYTPRAVDQLGNLLYGNRNPVAFEWAQRHVLCNANVPAGIAQVQGCEPLNPRRHEAFTQAFDAAATPHSRRERIFDLWDAAALLETDVRPAEIAGLADAERGPEINRHAPRLGRATLLTGWETFDDGRVLLERLFSEHHDPGTRVLLEAPVGEPLAIGGKAPPRSQAPARRADRVECEYGANSIRTAWYGGDGGMLRVLESWAPGWEATVNGEPAPILRADFLFMAIPVPPGSCAVELHYRPRSVTNGLFLSAGGLLLLVALFASDRRRGARPMRP